MGGEDTQIINAVSLICMVMGIKNAINTADSRHQHLLAEIGRGIDDHASHAIGAMKAGQQRAARAPIARLGRIAVAPVAVAARHSAR